MNFTASFSFSYLVFFGVWGSSSSLVVVDGDSRFRLELDVDIVLTQSAGQPQFSEQAIVLLRHLHRKVLQSVLHLQNV